MRLLLIPCDWLGSSRISGGIIMLSRIANYLNSQGHEIKVLADCDKDYIQDNIEVTARKQDKNHNDLVEWCDAIVTQLNGTSYAYNKAKQFDKPLIMLCHNTVTSYVVKYWPKCHVIYNSEGVFNAVHPKWDRPYTMFKPPVDYREYKRTNEGEYITLVNCNELKGGALFVQLAKELPHLQFLGVKGGYGEQITADLPNLIYLENGADMKEVYTKTKILLQPSAFETFGQAVLEAMCCDIPVIVHPTDGLKECVADSGQYADRNNLHEYKKKILNLIDNHKEWSDKAYKRAVELDPMPEYKRLEGWLESVINQYK